MARKKAGPIPEAEQPKTLFAVKGTQAWHDWLKDYAEGQGVAVMTVIDHALREQAKRDGFPSRCRSGSPGNRVATLTVSRWPRYQRKNPLDPDPTGEFTPFLAELLC